MLENQVRTYMNISLAHSWKLIYKQLDYDLELYELIVVELTVVCPWVCCGKSSQILRHLFAVACFSGDCGHWRLA